MSIKQVVGWFIFLVGLLCNLAFLAGIVLCIYQGMSGKEEAVFMVIVAAFLIAGMVLLALYTYCGWLLVHPAKRDTKHRKAIGIVTLIIGVLMFYGVIRVVIFDDPSVIRSDPYFFTGLVLIILSMIVGGYILYISKNKGHDIMNQTTPNQTDARGKE